MTLSYDLYWSFRSPYSYLVTPRLVALERDYDVACNVRPVYPLAVRTPEFFEQQDPLWLRYFMTDVFREAAFLGLPFRWPRPDPVQRSPDEGYRMEQPYIHRLTHLGVAAAERGRGLPSSTRSAARSGAARSTTGTRATIWPAPPSAPAWTSPRWPRRSTPIPAASRRSWRKTRSPSAPPATGACR